MLATSLVSFDGFKKVSQARRDGGIWDYVLFSFLPERGKDGLRKSVLFRENLPLGDDQKFKVEDLKVGSQYLIQFNTNENKEQDFTFYLRLLSINPAK